MTQIEVTDGDIAEAKSLIDSFDGPDEAVQGIAQTLAKLRVAREALEAIRAEYDREGSLNHHLNRCVHVQTKQALAQITQETPE